ncbi:hypothetical protein RF11_12470 [Thelohanellus kitauei]|uniref:Uncharacterized protein n=1 Tax=Thelohanellus kitauei TaxID=669202 RepID=A0A0C2N0F1_THEKT|nr:hypothetical protein RF11_12470 [Thelohanellus kitauei]
MLDMLDQICQERRKMFEEFGLSRRTEVHRIETIDYDMNSLPKRRVPSFQLFFQALNETTDIDDSAQWRKVGLMKRLSDWIGEVDYNKKLIVLYCIIHLQVLCRCA